MKAKYLICCLSMAFALVACGDDSSSGPDQVQSGETTVSSSSEKGDVSSSGTETSEVSSCSSAENIVSNLIESLFEHEENAFPWEKRYIRGRG